MSYNFKDFDRQFPDDSACLDHIASYDARVGVRFIRGQLGFVRVHNRSSKPLARFKHALTTILLNK